jgi:hypothetical protein
MFYFQLQALKRELHSTYDSSKTMQTKIGFVKSPIRPKYTWMTTTSEVSQSDKQVSGKLPAWRHTYEEQHEQKHKKQKINKQIPISNLHRAEK